MSGTVRRGCTANPPVTDELVARIGRLYGEPTVDVPAGAEPADVAVARAERLREIGRQIAILDAERQALSANRSPLEWRQQHGGVVWEERQIADVDGDIGNPRRGLDTLDALHRKGKISNRELAAGRVFQDEFDIGHLDPVRAQDMTRIRASKGRRTDVLPLRIERARSAVYEAMALFGGVGTPVGSACWEVVGRRLTIREYAERSRLGIGRHLSQETASGLVIGALGMLVGWAEDVRAESKEAS